jgi:hypothetical protein
MANEGEVARNTIQGSAVTSQDHRAWPEREYSVTDSAPGNHPLSLRLAG